MQPPKQDVQSNAMDRGSPSSAKRKRLDYSESEEGQRGKIQDWYDFTFSHIVFCLKFVVTFKTE